MPLTPEEIDAWAAAYIDAQLLPEDRLTYTHPFWWAVSRFMEVSNVEEAEDAWSTILRVVDRTEDDQVLGILAAGALEDLIGGWGAQFIDRIESEAKRSPRFHRVLQGVWEGGDRVGLRVRALKANGSAA